jgi:aspartate kinase
MQPLVVQKFGGTSVGSLDRIRHVANLVAASRGRETPVVVVSAMAGQTNQLLAMAREMSREPQPEAQALLLSTGEQVSCALLSMALTELGVPALPLTAFQVGILTDSAHDSAKIQSIETKRIRELLANGTVPVVAGFQGVDAAGMMTTLGRGGSDTSAVALAVALKADRCDIYTDVDGVYSADPRVTPKARRLSRITFAEMMELASLGAKVLHMRSVELAAKYGMPLRVLSTFTPTVGGTDLVAEESMLESPVVSAITSDAGQSLITLHVSGEKGTAQYPARFFQPLATGGVNVDTIIESPPDPQSNTGVLTLSVPRDQTERALSVLKEFQPRLETQNVVKVSVVGIGMRTHPGVASRIFDVLEKNKIPLRLVTTSEITVSVFIDEKDKDRAINGLHEAFEL